MLALTLKSCHSTRASQNTHNALICPVHALEHTGFEFLRSSKDMFPQKPNESTEAHDNRYVYLT